MMTPEHDISLEKERLRKQIWTLLEQKKVAVFPLPVRGRIPNFIGRDEAARLVRTLWEWKKAKVVFSCPDSPQKKIREFALKDGKILIMASPRLKHGFLQINPQDVKGKERDASSIRGAFKYGETLEDMLRPDLIITSCVAVDRSGWRLGKGGGYGDIEVRKIREEFGDIPVVTTVHPLQLVESVPRLEHDARVDIMVTPQEIYRIRET
jgi:5-formyltetrahydrofolate cyclo-ligase